MCKCRQRTAAFSIYLPLEHSENLADQERCAAVFNGLQTRFPARAKEFAESSEYAHQHLDIICRFGRFPHRKQILRRKPTAAEEHVLQSGGSRFGQR